MTPSRCAKVVAWGLILFAWSAAAMADNWPQWRGPHNNGICDEKNVPTKWSKTDNVAWRFPLPGQAGASPVVWGDRIFLTTVDQDDDTLLLLCVGTNGKELWRKVLGKGNKNARPTKEGNSASPSPSTDGKHVWTFIGTGMLACHDVEGSEVWKFDVQDRYGPLKIQFGMTSTPVLDGDRLYLQLIHGEGNPKTREAVVVCLDKATGKEVWKADRPSEAYAENEHSYASPCIYRDGKTEFLLTHGADYIIAHSLKDGGELWRSGGLQPDKYDPTLRLVASPACVPGLIVAPSAKGGRVLALKPDGKGDVTNSKDVRLWSYPITPDVPSPLIKDNLVYLYRENGVLMVLDAKTGEKQYEQRTPSSNNRASPVWANGNIYLVARDGTVTVLKEGRKYEEVATIPMGESATASPAFSNGRIYIRTYDALWAIGK